MTRPRAAIVVTGSELVRGERTDLNGPFYARQALSLGLEPGRITIVGDQPESSSRSALREGLGADVLLVSGGLGPTHDDRTIELVAAVTGRALVVDRGLEAEIEQISRDVRRAHAAPLRGLRPGGVDEAGDAPRGGHLSLGLAGTAPGVVLDTGVVRRRRAAGAARRAAAPLAAGARDGADAACPRAQVQAPTRRVLRFYGASESAVARALADAGGDGDGVEATICARDFEIHVDLVVEPGAEARADELAAALRAPLEQYLFAEEERTIQEIVLDLCRERGLTLATAESCTGGLVAARLTEVPGSSEVFRGGIVAYADDVKARELGVAGGRPRGARRGLGRDRCGDGGRGARAARGRCGGLGDGRRGAGWRDPEKPVGLVFMHASGPDGEESLRFEFPGERDWIRTRSAVAALHLVRRLLERTGLGQSRHEDA